LLCARYVCELGSALHILGKSLTLSQNKAEPEKGLNIGGSVINVASFVAKLGAATPQLAYTASKGAVLAMTRELAMIHAREGIRFNSLCP
jgi:NAD(P)-dependent dehydrogenase (short-subunit alcohol dehydrogenase family)